MKQKRKILKVLMLIGIMIMTTMGKQDYAQNSVARQEITLNNSKVYRTRSTTYVAVAEIFRILGSSVIWQQETKQVIIDYGKITFTLDETQVKTIKGNFKMDKPPINKDGQVYIPLNFFANILGYEVSYKEGIIKMSGLENLGQKGKYEEQIIEKHITISAAGDFTLGYYKGQSAGGRFDEVASANGYSYFMKSVKSIFETDDLTIVNLEGPLTTRGTAVEKQFAIRGLPDYTQILTSGSIEVVNLSNNHTYDYQKVGYTDTVDALNDGDIGYFGEENTYYTTVNDITVGVIGAKGWNNSSAVKEKLKKRISEAKAKSDLMIVMFHWGTETENYPNSIQQDLAQYVIDQGANLVLGSHPHVIQGIGNYKGSNIVYSMGNFCFGANKNPSDKDTFIYRESFVLTDEGIYSKGGQVIPCSISSTHTKNDYQPTLLTGIAKERVLNRMAIYSKNLK